MKKKPKSKTPEQPKLLFEIHGEPRGTDDFFFLGLLLVILGIIFGVLFAASLFGAPGAYFALAVSMIFVGSFLLSL